MEIPDIKSRLPLNDVLNYYGLMPDPTTSSGQANRINCPFHPDKTPSLQLYYKTNTCYCFSSNCPTHGRSLDVIDFIMHKEGLDKHQAILKAQTLMGGNGAGGENTSPPSTSPADALWRRAVLMKMFATFKKGLSKSPGALSYLGARHLDAERTEVGYNSGQFHHGTRNEQALVESCVKLGLLMERGRSGPGGEKSYSVFGKHCIVFPLKDKEGHIVSLYFRSTLDTKDGRHFYLKDRQGLYPCYPPMETKKLILTESVIDAATLLQQQEIVKQYQVLALYGTNGLMDEHREVIRELAQLEEIVFFFDGDDAGEVATEKYAGFLHTTYPNLVLSKVETPKGEDVNSLLNGHSPEILSHLIEERTSLFLSTEKQVQLEEKGQGQEQEQEQEKADPPRWGKLDARNMELLVYTTKELSITVLGGIRISGLDRLKVTLKIQKPDAPQIVRQSLDLYHGRQVEQLQEMLCAQLELPGSQATKVLAELTTALEEYRQGRLEAIKPTTTGTYQMSEQERKAALKYLKRPDLMEQTLRDITASGIVGEENNAMTGYIVNLSRKREKPLHVMYLGESGSGKTHLQEGLSMLVPEEDRIEVTGLSDQALYYEGLKLKGKILFIEDLDGAENVMYIIRELQSKGRITKRVAWRDNKGNTKTVEVVAKGPVVISSCTTRERLYEDNANRCILLYIDQGKVQDKRVMDYMKAKSTGKVMESEQETIRKRLQNAQRLLREVKVYNPYAELIELPDTVFKPRRSLPLLLGFIETVTFYHQYQREVKTKSRSGELVEPYIESSPEDIAKSFALLKDVLFAKSDELSRATREFLERLKAEVKPGESFYSKQIRQKLRISATSLKRYMGELQAYGYVKIGGGNRYRGYEYKVIDYKEYEKLRQGIEQRLDAILLKIKKISGPVVHSGPNGKVDHLKVAQSVS